MIKRLLAAFILGVTLTLAFAPFEIFPLAVLAPAGLMALWLNRTPKAAFWIGFAFGFGLFSSGVYWVFISIHDYGDVPAIGAVLITGGLAAILALFPATVGYLGTRYFQHDNSDKLIYAFPAVWMFSEWLRCWLGSGFPWLLLGYSQSNSPLKGYAPFLSVYGVSLAVILSSGLLANAILRYRQKNYRALYLSLFSLISIWALGGLLSLIPWTEPHGKPITVSIVQGNIPQSLKWSPDHIQLSFNRYEALSQPLWGKSNIIIWPEAAIPMPLQDVNAFVEKINAKAKSSGTELITGIPIRQTMGDGYFNAIATFGNHNEVYLKRRLVPYGEYVPLSKYFARIFDFMNVPMSNMVEGNLSQPPLNAANIKILPSICFEITFPELMRSQDRDLGILLTVTNDAWFNDSIAQAQHLQMAKMRAIELGRPLIFSSNDGITAVINPKGQVQAIAPTHIATVLTTLIQPTVGMTPWMHNGADPFLIILFALIFIIKRKARKKRNPAANLSTYIEQTKS